MPLFTTYPSIFLGFCMGRLSDFDHIKQFPPVLSVFIILCGLKADVVFNLKKEKKKCCESFSLFGQNI